MMTPIIENHIDNISPLFAYESYNLETERPRFLKVCSLLSFYLDLFQLTFLQSSDKHNVLTLNQR